MKVGVCRYFATLKERSFRPKMSIPGVFRSKESVINYLSKPELSVLEPVKSLLKLYDDNLQQRDGKPSEPRTNPFIVFEGLDGAGKSRLTRETVKRLSAVESSTPPLAISSLRPFFDSHPDKVLRRAFYSLGNYMAELEVIGYLSKRAVVMDRFWHSTATSAISELDDGDFPAEDNESWLWPIDLIKPDFVFFLDVSEETRMQRMSKRQNFSEDEARLRADASYRLKLTETFKKMKDPAVIVVDCEPIPKTVLKDIMSHIQSNSAFTD